MIAIFAKALSASWLAMLTVELCGAETIEDYICTKHFKGCRVNYKTRSCIEEEAVGCLNPFPYKDMKECLKDFYGKGNICEQFQPCENKSVCSPIMLENQTRSFKCECAHTGFYGHRCEIKCPFDLSAKDPRTLPCIEI